MGPVESLTSGPLLLGSEPISPPTLRSGHAGTAAGSPGLATSTWLLGFAGGAWKVHGSFT